jgi:uncharacterized protein YciI
VPEKLHILFYEYVEDIVERRAPHREAHLALIARWKEDGRLVMAGPVGDPPHGAVIVFRDGAESFPAEDPYVAAELVTAWRVEPWTVVT